MATGKCRADSRTLSARCRHPYWQRKSRDLARSVDHAVRAGGARRSSKRWPRARNGGGAALVFGVPALRTVAGRQRRVSQHGGGRRQRQRPLHQASSRAVRRIRSARRAAARRDRVLRSADVARGVGSVVAAAAARRTLEAGAPRSVTRSCIRIWCVATRATPTSSSRSRTTRGSVTRSARTSTCRWCACARSRTAATCCARPTTDSLRSSRRPARSYRRCRSSNRSCSTATFSGMSGVTPYGRWAMCRCCGARDRHRDFAVFPAPSRVAAQRLQTRRLRRAWLSFAGQSITVRGFPYARIMSSNADRYDAQAIESKWQAEWVRRGTNTFTEAQIRDAKEPFYNLMMFPYPSAEGLHIGNIYAFTGADVHGRYWRLRGKTVFEPIGFDAFGIHSENYALKVRHESERPDSAQRRELHAPAEARRRHVRLEPHRRYHRARVLQVDAVDLPAAVPAAGWSNARDGAGQLVPVVQDGARQRAGRSPACASAATRVVEQRRLPQWYLQDQPLRRAAARQPRHGSTGPRPRARRSANWIGRSDGAEVDFARRRRLDDARVRVFTTRPDTLFGATYMVLAPEHPLVDAITTRRAARRGRCATASDVRASATSSTARRSTKEKTGVFTGAYAINPANGARIPIWIADYVLMDYGTGAIMAVPGHDERDFEFAQRFGLPIVRVIAARRRDAPRRRSPRRTPATVRWCNSGRFDGLDRRRRQARASSNGWRRRGVARGEGQLSPARLVHLAAALLGSADPDHLLRDARRGAGAGGRSAGDAAATSRISNRTTRGISPLARVREWYETTCPQCGGPARRETDVSDTFLDCAWYFLRYPSSDRDDVAVRSRAHAQVAAGRHVHRRQRARRAAPACTRASSRWRCTTSASSTSRSRSRSSARTA